MPRSPKPIAPTVPAAAPLEIELKLAVRSEDVERVRRAFASWGPGRRQRVRTDYVDTPERLLAQHGVALRLRRIGRRWVQTLKSRGDGGALSVRGEWETPLASPAVDLAALENTPAAALVPLLAQAGALQPQFRTEFERTSWNIVLDGVQFEAALDLGAVRAGRGRGAVAAPLSELELELRGGDPAGLIDFALDLMAPRGAPALRPLIDSKATRGDRLARGQAAAATKAGASGFRAALPRNATTASALRAVVAHGTHVLLANVDGLLHGAEAEFVHQARVALRRMRSAARLLDRRGRDLPEALREEMRWFASLCGVARDLDVLLEETLPALEGDGAVRMAAVERSMRGKRTRAYRDLRAAAAGPRFARLALGLLRWSRTPAPKAPAFATVAPRRLERLRRRLLDSAAFFTALEAEQRHAVRIRAKRLRYALELAADGLPAAATAAWTTRLEALQDLLGAANDAAVAEHAVAQAGDSAAIRGLRAATRQFVRGSLMPTEKALLGLARAPAPWRRRRTR
jgi:triphosphatase